MKKVVETKQCDEISLSTCGEDGIYFAKGKKDPIGNRNPVGWILSNEKNGFIFRWYTDNRNGMYGYYPTLRSAILSAMDIADIYQFSSLKELVDYLKNEKIG